SSSPPRWSASSSRSPGSVASSTSSTTPALRATPPTAVCRRSRPTTRWSPRPPAGSPRPPDLAAPRPPPTSAHAQPHRLPRTDAVEEVAVLGDDVPDDVDRGVGRELAPLEGDLALVAAGGVVVHGHRPERPPHGGTGRDRDVRERPTGTLEADHGGGIVRAVAVRHGEPLGDGLRDRCGELDLELDDALR